MKRAVAILALSLVAAPAGGSDFAVGNAIDRLAWLAGCWEQQRGETLTQEQWMTPKGGTMMGVNRTVARGKTVAYEFLRIEERSGGRLFLIAKPSGQPEAEFMQTELSDSSVTFSNPTHDFPQRIRYRHDADGSIVGRIEGESDGEARAVDFPLVRVDCEGNR